VGELFAWPTAEPSAAKVSAFTEMLLSTNSSNFCPVESGSVLEAMSGKTMDFLSSRLYKATGGIFERALGAARQIARSAGMAAEAAQLLDSLAATDWPLCRVSGCCSLSVTALRRLPLPRQRNLIRYWLRRQGFQAPSALHLDQVLGQVASEPRSRQALVSWPEAEIWRYRDELMARKPRVAMDSALKMSWNLCEPLEIPGVGFLRTVAAHGDGLSQERIGKSLLTVGLRQGGEICRLPGRTHRHKLKKLLQEAGVPPWERCRLPLVYVNGELAAVADRWVCEPYAARADEAGWKLRLELVSEFNGSGK
jgi:tRNA(Ile)-lysidine synthase